MTFLVGCFDGMILTFGFWYTKTLDVTLATLIFGLSRMTCSAQLNQSERSIGNRPLVGFD